MSIKDAVRADSFYQDIESKRQAEELLSQAKTIPRKTIFVKQGISGEKLVLYKEKENMNKTINK